MNRTRRRCQNCGQALIYDRGVNHYVHTSECLGAKKWNVIKWNGTNWEVVGDVMTKPQAQKVVEVSKRFQKYVTFSIRERAYNEVAR